MPTSGELEENVPFLCQKIACGAKMTSKPGIFSIFRPKRGKFLDIFGARHVAKNQVFQKPDLFF